MASIWYVRDRGRVMGPFSTEQLVELRESGELRSYSEVSTDSRIWRALDLALKADPPPQPLVLAAPAAPVRIAVGREPVPQGNRAYRLVIGGVVSVIVMCGISVVAFLALRPGKIVDPPSKPRTPQELFAEASPSIAMVDGYRSTGTAFVVRPRLLATNAHVVGRQFVDQIKVNFPKKEEKLKVRVVHFDAPRDLALLAIDIESPPLNIEDNYRLQASQSVMTIGFPGFADRNLKLFPSRGEMGSEMESIRGQAFFPIQITINPGNSGGPVMEMRSGRVVGVISAKATKQDGIAFAVPAADLAKAILDFEKATPDQLDAIAQRHRAIVAFYWLRRAGSLYSKALDICLEAVDNAGEKKLNVTTMLAAVRKLLGKDLDDLNGSFTQGLNQNLSVFLQPGPHIAAAVQETFRNLHANYNDMKVLFAKPGGRTVFDFRDRVREYQRLHNKHVEALKIQYGIDDD
jgi:S1-C subfamily serine protease